MILIIDNYDSFVYNLARYTQELGHTTRVIRHDAISVEAIKVMRPSHIIISPGPCSPREAGVSNEVIRVLGPHIPILGVCLGHQCIGHVFGGEIIRAPVPMHGKVSPIHHNEKGLFANVPSPLQVTRYHSLVINPAQVPDCLQVTAQTEDGVIMAVEHKNYPISGVQFHPEAHLTQSGHALLTNFLTNAKDACYAA